MAHTYLIDKQGNIRYVRIGEGAYDQTDQAIRDLRQKLLSQPDDTYVPSYLTPMMFSMCVPRRE
jgi:hypothetical protein